MLLFTILFEFLMSKKSHDKFHKWSGNKMLEESLTPNNSVLYLWNGED